MPIVRRLRGIAVSAVLWGLAWGPGGVLLGLALVAADPGFKREGPHGAELVAFCGVLFATLGATAGTLFATLIVLVSRFRPVERLSPWEAAALGAIPAALSSLQATDRLMEIVGFAILGAALAAGSVTIAQRSSRQ